MKTNFSILFAAILALSLTGCSKESPANSSTSSSAVTTNPPPGSWRVNLFFDKTDETSDFAGFNFTFDNTGKVMAARSSASVTGSWSGSSTKFILNFGADPILDELNNDWQIVEFTTTSIKLKDDNPAQDDRLEFIRN